MGIGVEIIKFILKKILGGMLSKAGSMLFEKLVEAIKGKEVSLDKVIENSFSDLKVFIKEHFKNELLEYDLNDVQSRINTITNFMSEYKILKSYGGEDNSNIANSILLLAYTDSNYLINKLKSYKILGHHLFLVIQTLRIGLIQEYINNAKTDREKNVWILIILQELTEAITHAINIHSLWYKNTQSRFGNLEFIGKRNNILSWRYLFDGEYVAFSIQGAKDMAQMRRNTHIQNVWNQTKAEYCEVSLETIEKWIELKNSYPGKGLIVTKLGDKFKYLEKAEYLENLEKFENDQIENYLMFPK